MLTLGYKASAEQFGPRALLDFAIRAERTGFDSVFVSDHYQPWRHTDGHAPNCYFLLLQTLVEGPSTIHMAGTYYDRFVRVDGALLLKERQAIYDTTIIANDLVYPL